MVATWGHHRRITRPRSSGFLPARPARARHLSHDVGAHLDRAAGDGSQEHELRGPLLHQQPSQHDYRPRHGAARIVKVTPVRARTAPQFDSFAADS